MSDAANSEQQAPEPKRHQRRNWDAVAALIATMVGLLALLVSGYTAYIQRQQVRAQVWPSLMVGNDDLTQSLDVYSKGVGPAIIRGAQVLVDGKPQPDWKHVLRALKIKQGHTVMSTINPNVLSPGEVTQMLRITDADQWRAFRTAARGHLSLSLCYCSALGDCWQYSNAQPVDSQSSPIRVQALSRCPRLPPGQMFKD